jgi:hypothetical protein
VANTLSLLRNGAVGFIDWLDVGGSQTISADCAPDVKTEEQYDRERENEVNCEQQKALPNWLASEECECAANRTA